MLNLAEYRKKPRMLADFLPWAALVAPGVILNKDGSFQRTARFRGPDLDSATPAELVGTTARLNNALRRLGSGWALFVEASRVAAQRYPQSQFPDPVSTLVDAERRAQFEEAGAHFESAYYLTFLWLPPSEGASRAERWLYEGRSREGGVDAHELLNGFIDRTDRVLQLVEGFVPESAWLSDSETLTYLHSTISTRRHRVRVPEIPVHLDALLADEPLTCGLEPRLGNAHLRILTIIGFPTVTFPGILDELNRLAFPYRWSTRAIFLDKPEAARLLTKIRRQWFAKRKSIMAILKEVMTNESSALLDSDAHNKALDADAALQELGSDAVSSAYVTATVTVWDDEAASADEKLRLVEKVIQSRDFTCMPETVNAVEAWLGSLPGHVYANVRQPPVSTLNLAHMMPLSAVWAGPERDEHLGAPPLFFARTEGSTPFRFSLHVGDVGHTLVIGPTGAGKSVLLALMALQFRRYPRSQVFAFDFGGSIRAAALAMGGDWHDLGGALAEDPHAPVALQPLATLDDAAERTWAAEWVAAMLTREGVTVSPAPVAERTLTGLCVLLQSGALKRALQPYCLDGPYGRLLDAEASTSAVPTCRRSRPKGSLAPAPRPLCSPICFIGSKGVSTGGRPFSSWMRAGWRSMIQPSARDCANGSRRCARRMPLWCSPPSRWPISRPARSRPRSSRAARRGSSFRTSAPSSHRSSVSTSVSGSMTARSRSSPEQHLSATITASLAAAIACSSSD
jgi:type IV secretion system protein TrbE